MLKNLFLVAGAFCFVAVAALAESLVEPSGFSECKTLEDCLAALDVLAVQRPSGASSSLDSQLATRMEQFGLPAKRELLKRAASDNRGWRNLAGAVLMYWQSLEPADVPALIDALHKQPGGWIARPLGRIGTPDAIEALAEDVRQHGAENQSGWALSQIGDRVFPYLLPLLSDDKQWHSAAAIMRDMKSKARDGLSDWLSIALDAKRPDQDRVGALRGIGILGTSAKEVAPQLRTLLTVNDGYGPIPDTAKMVLEAMGDQSMASEYVLACEPSTNFVGSYDSTVCLERAAAYGGEVIPFANLILLKFTDSLAGIDRANGASILGFVGYLPAKQRLIELLKDDDWRVVFAAARSLGWLRAKEAIPALTVVARSHWLADVRKEALEIAASLRSQTGSIARPQTRSGTLGFVPTVPLEVDATFAPDEAPCETNRWSWQGKEFREPDDVVMTVEVHSHNGLPGGSLVGRDNGEWGGEVKWETNAQAPSLVAVGNVEGIQSTTGGAIAVIGGGGIWTSYDEKHTSQPGLETITVSNGPGGSGYALALHRDASGAWRAKEVARFPRAAFGLTAIGRDQFAVWSGNRAIVFNPSGILGVAQCNPSPPAKSHPHR